MGMLLRRHYEQAAAREEKARLAELGAAARREAARVVDTTPLEPVAQTAEEPVDETPEQPETISERPGYPHRRKRR